MHPDATNEARRQSFGAIAADYDRYRPPPPDEAIRFVLPPEPGDVLDIGAGTGGLTRRLLAHGARVHALEPDPRMRAVLAGGAPEAEVLAGKAEAIPAGDGAFTAVVGSSSWHWVDEARAVPEVARVLKPGGTFGLLWSGTDRSVDWMRALWAGGIPVDEDRAAAMDARRRRRHAVDLGTGAPFTEPEVQVVRWTRPMTADELLGMAATYSEVIIMEPEVRRAHLDAMARFLHDQQLPVTSGAIDVPMRCICWRTIRI